MFNNTRLKIEHRKLRKQLATFSREKKVYNLTTARRVAILFYAENEKVFQQVTDFGKFLENLNLRVEIVAYTPEKEIPTPFQNNSKVKVFTCKDINWIGKPLPDFVNAFMAKDFDILIDLSTQEIFPLQWVASLSKAKFKVGNLAYSNTPNDLIINIKPDSDLTYLITQTKHYLNLINNRFAETEG
ncbi:MAG: hypothetical protein PHI03_05045 [Bacteroidales bacterium]|nr:hypothetical protein [Bacteroidales bacterium]